MRKMMIGTIVLMIALMVCFFFLAKSFTQRVEKDHEKYKAKIGQKIILENDTLTIIDYSSIKETFTLSNGVEVSFTFVQNKQK